MNQTDGRRIEAVEPAHTPPAGLALAYLATVPLALGALALWTGPTALRAPALDLSLLWGAAILTFLSGVRRGVSFRQPDGPRMTQIAMMLWLFAIGFVALALIPLGGLLVATGLELVGFVTLAVFDPLAARRGEAPLFFERLRPPQMAVPILSLLALGAFVWQAPVV